MKTILVPTDYSAIAENAMRYAVELAKFEKSKVILFHAYMPRILLSSLTLMDRGFEEENLNKLEHYRWELEQKHGKSPEIEIMVRSGFTVNGILNVIKEKQIDMVVMGTTGAGMIQDALLGNTTIDVIQSTDTPVLVIPPDVKFKIPEKIAVALDHLEAIPDIMKENIMNYVKGFKSNLTVFNLMSKETPALHGVDDSGEETFETMDDLKYEVCRFSGGNILEELNNCIDNQKVDWLILAPQNHPQLSGLFYKNNTKKMAFHTHIPVLSIHV